MESEPGAKVMKQASYKTNEEQNRGFKPVVPIPLTAPLGQADPMGMLNKDLAIPLELKLNNIYQEYLRLLKENRLIRTTIQHVNKERVELMDKLESIQSAEREEAETKKKRHRRNASEIVRDYVCPIQDCEKSYGAQASLSQHVKLKHLAFYESPQYTKFMEDLIRRNHQDEDES